jgi:uncharacterized lipoprotein YmbA
VKPLFLAAAALSAAVLLAGCGHSPDTALFVLTAQTPQARSAYAGPPIQVRAVRLPPQFDRPEVLDDGGGGAVTPRSFAQWAAPVGELARSALTSDLAARLPEGQVIYPDSPAPAGALLISVDFLDARISGAAGSAEASWSVVTPGPRPGVAAVVVTHTASLHVPPQGFGPAGDAGALSRLLAQLSDRIVASL